MGTRIIALASSSLVVLAVAAGISATSFAQEPDAFQGVWRTVEVTVPGPPPARSGPRRHSPCSTGGTTAGSKCMPNNLGHFWTIRRRLPPTSCALYGDPLSARRVRLN